MGYDHHRTVLERLNKVDEDIIFIPNVRSVGTPLSVGGPETSMLLVGMLSSTNPVPGS